MVQSIREILEKPFEPNLIKTRKGNFGNELSYVEGHAYIKRLNEAFNGQWSFEIISHEVNDQQVIVVGKLTADGIVKMSFGCTVITKNSETKEIVSIGDDLKAAATDALKKAASFLGVGLHLYEGQETKVKTPGNGNGNGTHGNNGGNGKSNGNGGRLTSRQLAAIYAIAKSKEMSKDDVQRMTVRIFDRVPDFLTKSQASEIIQHLQAN